MTTLTHFAGLHRATPLVSGSAFAGQVLTHLRRTRSSLIQAYRETQTRRALAMLDPETRQDIGLSIDMDLH